MARKPTDKQLFKMKNEWLGQFYEEVKPKDFYRAVFPEGSFEREGHPEDLDGLKEIYPELKRQGNNLNQIAKKLNENGYVDYKQELPNTMKEVREVWQLLKQYLQKQA